MSGYAKQSESTKRKILIAAKSEFAEKGYDGAKTSFIAKRAGVNKALVYYHFSSKEILYKKVFQKFLCGSIYNFVSDFQKEIDSWETSPELKICAVVYIIVTFEFYINDAELGCILSREFAGASDSHSALSRDNLLIPVYSLYEVINDGINKNVFQISNSKLLSFVIVSLVKDIVKGAKILNSMGIFETAPERRRNEIYYFILEFVFKSLKKEDREESIPDISKERIMKLDIILKKLSYEINNI